ncbi:MAG: hypothetical protein J0J15_19175, partial [Mesorhizobium sp.]|nr:hypothetical protein [Mesorhizobium sp.]
MEAQNDRVRSTVTLLDQMRRENDLIGKNAGEVAAAQFAHQRLMEIRDEAIRNGITNEQEFQRVFGKEIALIGEAAAKVKEYAEASARAHLKDDLGFDAAQLGRSPIEQRVASTMRQYGLGNDLNGPDAAIIRTNERLKQQVDIWKDIRKSGMDAYSDIFDLAFDGFDNWKDRLSDIAKDMAKNLFDMSVKNPFLNRQYGADLPTLDQAGGLGGWINTLLGGSPNPAAGLGQLGTMANPMYVVPVGGLGGDGGIVGDVTRLLSGANDNGAGNAAKTVASLVPGGGALASAAGQALSFVGNYKQGVDNRLTDILSEASQRFGGFGVSAFSGRRPGDPRFHGQGLATDVRLTDLASGKALANYQDPSTFRTYEQFAQVARQVQMEKYPELADQFRWGGYFSGGRGKYGAMDQMHFDLGGGKVGMAGGSWANGLTPAQRALFPGVESLGMGANKAVAALGRLDVTTTAATQNLGQFGSGLGQFGQNLAKSVSQASGGGSSGGGFFGMLASPFGGGQTRFA